MDSLEFPRKPDPDWRPLVLGVIAWGWILWMGWLYLDANGLRLEAWARATIFGAAAGGRHVPVEPLAGILLAGVVAAVAWALGRAVGARMGLWRGEAGEHAAAILAGLAMIGMGVFAIGVAGLLVPAALIGLLIAASGATWAAAPDRPRWKTFWRSGAKGGQGGGGDGIGAEDATVRARCWGVALLPWSIAAAALGVSFLAALAPAVESDGLRYHLFGPQEYLRAGRIHYIPHSAFTNFPFLVEMLFTLGLGLGNDVAAKLLHWIHLPLAGLLIAALARQMGGRREVCGAPLGTRLGAWLGAAVFVSTPVAAIVAGWSFIDLAITAFFLALVWSLARWMRDGQRKSDLIAAGFFAGAAIGTKYTMLAPAMLAGAVVVGWTGWTRWTKWTDPTDPTDPTDRTDKTDGAGEAAAGPTGAPQAIRLCANRAAVFALAAGICAAPWFVKNVVLTGNPVYPLAHGIFGGGDWSAEAAAFYHGKAGEKGALRGGVADFIAAPFDTAFYWVEFESQNPGVVYLLLFPILVGWIVSQRRRKAREVVSGVESQSQSQSNSSTSSSSIPIAIPIAIATVGGTSEASDESRVGDGRRAVWIVAGFALATGVVFFAGYKSNRFLLPIWAVTAALAGALVDALGGVGNPGRRGSEASRVSRSARFLSVFSARSAVVAAMVAGSLYGLYWTARYIAVDQKPSPLPVVFGFESRDAYLSSALSYYPATQWLAVQADPGEKVFYIGEYHGYPSAAEIGVSDWFDVPLVLAKIRGMPDNDALLDRLRADGYRFVLVSFTELRAYGAAYLRPRFSEGEWTRFQDLLGSPRLKPRYEQNGVTVFEIRNR